MSTPALQSPRSVAFADLWYQTRASKNVLIPTKTDLPLRALAPFMPHIAMIEHTSDGRARYILFGTALVSTFGQDLTGDHVEGPMTDEARTCLEASRAAFWQEHGPDTVFGRWTIGHARTSTGRKMEFENLTFPYIEASNGSVRFMSFVFSLTTLDYGEGVVQRFPDRDVKMFNAKATRPTWMQQDPHASCLITEPDVA